MAFVTNLYSDPQCKNSLYTPSVGVAGITGYWSNQSQWTVGATDRNGNKIRYAYINRQFSSGIVLSGGSILFNFDDTPDGKIDNFFNHPFSTDRISNSSQNAYNNVLFYGINGNITNYIHFARGSLVRQINVILGAYHQTPENGSFSERTSWNYEYTTTQGYSPTGNISAQFAGSTKFGCVKMYTINIFNIDHIMIAFGVDFSGNISPNAGAWPPTFILIPVSMFQDKPNKPYVGPVSKDSAEAFTPTTPKRDSITSRDLTGKVNPYGFNTGNGLKLVVMTAEQQAEFVKQLYTGLSGDGLNQLGQIVSGIVGGNAHRPIEELQAMINAVLCCHILPVITTGYSGGATTLYTLAGYQLYNTARAVNAVLNQIVTYETGRTYIAPIVNNFLTYAPYCSVSLTVPFVGDIPLDPSILFESSLYFVFYLDLYTGTLSVDVHAVDDGGRDFIYTTRQTNCAVDIPIMGTGATGNPLQKIASAAGNVASSGVAGAPAALFNIAGAYHDSQQAVPVGRSASSNIAPYFSQRHCYLVIEYPESSNPDNFFDLQGGVSEMAGTVGSFSGYTEFRAVDLSAVSGATDAEKREIIRMLQEGVII